MEEGARLWDALWDAGQAHGVVRGIGVYATTGRLEKRTAPTATSLELDFDFQSSSSSLPWAR